MKTYILVGQSNWEEKLSDSNGRKYTAITHKVPPSLEAAHNWPGAEIVEADEPPVRWGHGTYEVKADGKLELVAHDWDSSG